MYQSHFCLQGRPFAAAPNPEHYYPAASIERARESLMMSVERAAGAAIVIGDVGTGKTLLCQLVANQFSRELPVCMLSSGRLGSRRVLVQSVLNRLGLPITNRDEGELRLALTDHILGPACPRGILLIVDEADRLPLELLEEVRVITNLVQNGEPRVRLVLTGDMRLEERMSHTRLESLNQRVVARLYLENFTAEETSDYVRARITACGGAAESLFTDEALYTIFQATSGVPRLVNQVCDHALILAAVGGHHRLDPSGIQEAWSDLQQLPLPPCMASPAAASEPTASPVVEFGPLDDETAVGELFSGKTQFDPSQRLEDIERKVASMEEETSMQRSSVVDPPSDADEEPRHSAEADEKEPTDSFHVAGSQPDEQATGSDEEDLTTAGRPRELDLTIDQATNPFAEEFEEEEEVVIRQFEMPSKIARRSEFQVVSAQSRELARQLTAAHPGLRMHPHQDAVDLDDFETSESEGFQPLTAYLHDEDDPGALERDPDESAPPAVSLTGPQGPPAMDASTLAGPEVVIQFDRPPSVWADAPPLSDADRAALGPAPVYDSDGLGAVEQPSPKFPAWVAEGQEGVIKDQATSQSVVASAGFYPGIYGEMASKDAAPPESFGPCRTSIDPQACETPESFEGARSVSEDAKPRLFRRLFSNLRRTLQEDD